MSFDDRPARPPIYPREAEDYARDALILSRRAADRVRSCPDLPYGDDYWQKLDIYLPDDAEPGASHFAVALRLADPECATTATLRAWLRDGPSGFAPDGEDHLPVPGVHPEEK